MMSFKYVITNRFRYCRITLLIISYYVVETFVNSNDIIMYSYNLYCMRKIVFYSFFIFILI